MPFGDWLDLWYKTYSKPNIRITTQLSYENRIYLHIIPSIGKIPLNKLTQTPTSRRTGGNQRSSSTARGCQTAWCVPAIPHAARRCRRR